MGEPAGPRGSARVSNSIVRAATGEAGSNFAPWVAAPSSAIYLSCERRDWCVIGVAAGGGMWEQTVSMIVFRS